MISNWRDSDVVSQERHGRILDDLHYYAELAGIRPEFFWQPLSEFENVAFERKYLERFDHVAKKGLMYTGKYVPAIGPDVTDRMQIIAGCMMRNFVDARVRNRAYLDQDGVQECTVLLIPDLFMGVERMTGPERSAIASLLALRQSRSLQTVVYISNVPAFSQTCGEAAGDIVSAYLEVHL